MSKNNSNFAPTVRGTLGAFPSGGLTDRQPETPPSRGAPSGDTSLGGQKQEEGTQSPMSVKWLDIVAGDADRDHAKGGERVSPSAGGSAVVEEFPEKPLNLVTVWGAARTGKSFFLNALARVDGLFRVSGAMEPCTSGADLSLRLLPVGDLNKGDGTTSIASGFYSDHSSSSGAPMVGFVDVEGQGDRHASYDVLLATPLLLLSKMAIFNWKGRPNKATMLDQLAIMTNAAKEIGRPHRKQAFGHLVVLLRDVSGCQNKAYDILFGTEDEDAAESDEEQHVIETRNGLREKLRDAFQSIQVWCLPCPHSQIDVKDGVNLSELNPDFLKKVADIRGMVANRLAEPHVFGGEVVLGGFVLSTLMTRVCENVNERGKDIVPCSLMESVQRQRVDALGAEARKDFKSRIAAFESGDGISSKAETERFVQDAYRDVVVTFFNRATKDFGKKIADKARIEVAEGIEELSKACLMRHEQQVMQLQAVVLQHIQTAKNEVDEQACVLEARMPMRANGELTNAWKQMCIDAHKAFDKKISETMRDGLRQDLAASIPTVEQLKTSLERKFRSLIELNKMHIEVEDARCGAEARDRMISEMNENIKKGNKEGADKLQELQKQYEARAAILTRQMRELEAKANNRGCVIS